MSKIVNLFKLFNRHMGVNLRCGNGFMTEQLLDSTNISTTVEEMGGKRVTQYMGTTFLLKRYSSNLFSYNAVNLI